jgi:hypothetical protein
MPDTPADRFIVEACTVAVPADRTADALEELWFAVRGEAAQNPAFTRAIPVLAVRAAPTLAEAVAHFDGWRAETDADGTVRLAKVGEIWVGDGTLLAAVLPHTVDGCYVQVRYADRYQRWVNEGGRVRIWEPRRGKAGTRWVSVNAWLHRQ